MEYPFVTIIIPTYHEWPLLKLCIEALEKQSYPKEHFEVLIVNNDPADAPPADFELPGNMRLLNESKTGSYAARNKALSEAKGEMVAFTDSDCIPDRDWITNGVAYLQAHPECSRIAGRITIYYKGKRPTPAELYNTLYAFPQQSYVQKSGACVTANLFTYKKVMDSVGWFDDRLYSCGDLEWGRAAARAGYPIHYVANVMVAHPARNFAELRKKERRVGGGIGIKLRGQGTMSAVKKSLHFLNGFRPRIAEVKFVMKNGNELGPYAKLKVLLMRHYLLNLRLLESIKVQLGKTPNRA